MDISDCCLENSDDCRRNRSDRCRDKSSQQRFRRIAFAFGNGFGQNKLNGLCSSRILSVLWSMDPELRTTMASLFAAFSLCRELCLLDIGRTRNAGLSIAHCTTYLTNRPMSKPLIPSPSWWSNTIRSNDWLCNNCMASSPVEAEVIFQR